MLYEPKAKKQERPWLWDEVGKVYAALGGKGQVINCPVDRKVIIPRSNKEAISKARALGLKECQPGFNPLKYVGFEL